jgi:hypothetical protein
MQKEIQIKRIIKGVVGEYAVIFNDDSNSIYIVGKDTISIRRISEYDNTGNIVKFSVYLSEGILEYSIEELMADTLLLNFSTAGRSVKDWKFVGNNKITNGTDTLRVKTRKNNFNKRILVNQKQNIITIFEY